MSTQTQEAENPSQNAVDYSEAENREISRDYKIVAKQGAGGCSVVYDAWRVADGHHVAIKVLSLPDDLEESEAKLTKARFYREARILSTIKNEHCVHCLEYGLFSGAPCVVLDFVDGQQLDKYMREFGALPFEYGVDIICQVLEALEEAHSHGIIHRDIKPANIMIIQDSDPPVVRLIDFGIATILEGALGELMKTKLGVIRGTPSYMAPELFSGTVGASPESDIYSVGLVLYEIITGCVAVGGSSLVQIAFKQAHEPLQIPQNIPECLANVIRKCCDKEAADRYHNARDVINALREVLPEAVKQRAKCESNYLQAIRDSGVSRPSVNITTGLELAAISGQYPSHISGQYPASMSSSGMQASLIVDSGANNKTMRIVIAAAVVVVLLLGVMTVVLLSKGGGDDDSARLYKEKVDAEAALKIAEERAKLKEAEAAAATEAARAAAAEAAREAEAAKAAEAARKAEEAKAAAAAAAAKAAEPAQVAAPTPNPTGETVVADNAAKPAGADSGGANKTDKTTTNKKNNSKKSTNTKPKEDSQPAVTAPSKTPKKPHGDPTSIPLDIF